MSERLDPPSIEEAHAPPVWPVGEFRLRPMRLADAQAWHQYLCDPQVIEHTSFPMLDLADVERMVANQLAGYANGTSCRWAVADSDDRLAGTCGFSNWSLPHSHAELVYDLSPAFHGRGLMRAAVTQVLDWAFGRARFNRVHAFVMTSNTRSIRLLESAGFSREGTLREYRVARGTPRDFHVYSRLASGRS